MPDLFTQMKPYLNNINSIITRQNSLKGSLTSNNYSKILSSELLLPKKSPEFANKKTLILDLDETLVHSSFIPFKKNDIVLNVDFDGFMYKIYVLVRPGAELFIRNMSKYYEVVIFTASLSNYASPLLNILDKGENIKYRLYRENCTFMNGVYIKDLKRLNRNLKDLVIVDNSPLAYSFDIDNGLPIKTWYEDKNDIELYKINDILEFLSTTDDVRNYIKKFVKKNQIIYEEAINLIKSPENKKILENNIFNSNNIENKSNNVSLINNSNSKIITGNNLEKANNTKENISLNLEPVANFCESKAGIRNSENNNEIEKNINNENAKNQKKHLKIAAVLYNSQIKKNNFISFQDIHKIKKRNNILENKKINERQIYKNNNFFRLNNKKGFSSKEENNIILSLNNSSKLKPIKPNTFSNSSSPNIKSLVFSTTKNLLSKNKNLLPKKEEKFNLKMKNNYINLIQDKKEKKRYTNILRQINNTKNNILKNNIIKYEKIGVNNPSKSKLRISSSTASHRNYSPLNVNKKNYKILMSFPVQRSKSTVHFFYDKIYNKPNEHMIIKNEKRKFDNLFGDISHENIPKYNILGYNLNKSKQRRIQTAKIYKSK